MDVLSSVAVVVVVYGGCLRDTVNLACGDLQLSRGSTLLDGDKLLGYQMNTHKEGGYLSEYISGIEVGFGTQAIVYVTVFGGVRT